MAGLYVFMLKSLLVSGVLLGYYWIALRNKRFHAYNRFYLMGTLVISMLLPLFNFDWIEVDAKPEMPLTSTIITFIDQPAPIQIQKNNLGWESYAVLFLMVISAFLFLRFILGITTIWLLKKRSKVIPMDHFDFIETEHEEAPFSFFRNLFWKMSMSTDSEIGQQVLKHELVHIKQGHTWDKLLVGFLSSVIWVNPFFWIIKRELEVVHEYMADEQSIEGADSALLATFLLESHYQHRFSNSSQSLFYSSIKRRIAMISTSKKSSYSYLRRMLVLPIIAGIVLVSSFTVKDNASEHPTASRFESGAPVLLSDTSPKPIVVRGEWLPGEKGKEYFVKMTDKWAIFLDPKTRMELMRIPKSQLASSSEPIILQGYKIVADSFQTITGEAIPVQRTRATANDKYSVVVGRPLVDTVSVNDLAMKEIAVVGYPLPNKIEGEQHLQFPDGALILVEGKNITAENVKLIELDPASIESINVLKASPALIQQYGAKAAGGVILIKLKK